MPPDSEPPSHPRVRETYHAAIQHELIDLTGDERLVGVVRRPTHWFSGAVEENQAALGPPAELLDEVKAKHEALKRDGLCDTGAHNAAWEEIDFEQRYLEHLQTDPAAQSALDELREWVEQGETVVLVCYEADDKACHRHLVKRVLDQRLASA